MVVATSRKVDEVRVRGDCGGTVVPDAMASAKLAGLRYVSDVERGIRREATSSGFRFLAADGSEVTDDDEIQRIRKLAIPPAWTDVWISPRANGHLQATGRDARGRKQYRYHTRWREVRDEAKYGRMVQFGEALPAMRKHVERDLALAGMPREKVLAAVVRLLESTLIRVGNEEYARSNDSYGLTTMRDDHVDISGSSITFEFRGKSGKDHSVGLRDARLARIVKRSRDLPGQELFQYVDQSGERRTIGSGDVNDYLREISGQEFTAKDFRTWAGTVVAAATLRAFGPAAGADAKRNIVRTFEIVAERLGNTPAISRKCYVHPTVVEAYLFGRTINGNGGGGEPENVAALPELRSEERAVLRLLTEAAA